MHAFIQTNTHVYTHTYMYAFAQPLHYLQDVMQGQFLAEFKRFGFWVFFYSSCHTNVKELTLPYYIPIARERTVGFNTFAKDISSMWNANSIVQDLNSVHCVPYLRQ